MKAQFTGKTALVTGAASGIGAAAALLYAHHGAKVIVADINEKGGRAIVTRIKNKNGEATFIRMGAGSLTEYAQLIKRAVGTYGSIDIACNNINAFGESGTRVDKNPEAFDNEVDLNLDNLFYCMKFEIAAMHGQNKGVIVNITHAPGALGFVAFNPYVQLTYGVAELMPTLPTGQQSAGNIRISAVTPALMNAALLENMNAAENPSFIKLSPIDRMGRIEEVARLVIWLSSDKALCLPAARDRN